MIITIRLWDKEKGALGALNFSVFALSKVVTSPCSVPEVVPDTPGVSVVRHVA